MVGVVKEISLHTSCLESEVNKSSNNTIRDESIGRVSIPSAAGGDLNDFTAVRVSMPLDLTGDSDGDKVDFQRKAEQSTLTAAK